jgi:DNA-binding SARP family transcriptional activator
VIRLRVFGEVEVCAPDCTQLVAVVRQPKRLALFLYLLLSERRFHRRDSLLALFWPEHDDQHARAALRRSLHFLRIHLGTTAIDTRGDDDVGVAPDAAWCDATAFSAAMRTGKYEDALTLYRGDLLEGMHIASAPEVGQWLDDTRARHRREAVRAASILADTAEKAGDADAAVRWSARAAKLADDEAGIAAHLQRLGRFHRGSEALATYRRYADRLAATLELEPSAALRALADRVATARDERRRGSTLHADVIAVFPFSVRGLPEFEYLREGMVDLLSAKLDAAGSVRTVDPYALLRHVRQAGAPDDAAGARAVAAAFEAGTFVLGSLVAEGDRVHATAILYETGGPGEVRAHVEAPREAGPYGFVDALTLQMLTHGRRHAVVPTLTAAMTQSLPALKHYLVGEERFRLSRYDESREEYAEAIALDPSFALAHYRHAAAAAACGAAEDAIAASHEAVRHRERLGAHDRLLLDAQVAWFAGEAETAEVLWERVIGEWPDDIQAWFLLGNLQFDFNPMRGRSSTEARAAFVRTLELDRDHVASLTHLARIEAMDGRLDELARLAERIEVLSPGSDQALAVRGMVVFARSDRAAQLAWLGTLAGRRLPTLARVAADIAQYSSDVASRDWLAREVPRLAPAGTLGVLEQVILAYAAAEHGDPDTIDAAFRRTAQSPGQSLLHRAFLAMLPTRARNHDTVARVRTALEAWTPGPPAPQPNVILGVLEEARPLLRAYVLGLAAAWLEDERAALTHADACREMAAPHLAPRLPAQLGAGIRGRLALLQGHPEETLRQLDGLGWPGWPELSFWSPFHSHAAERLLHAEALAACGRGAEAKAWALGLGQRSPYDLAFRGEAARLGLIPAN